LDYDVETWLQSRLSRISLRELNFYTIVFILLFTFIFSSLLIYDEYKDFLKTAQNGLEIGKNNSTEAPASFQDLPKTRLIKVMVEIATLALILFGFIVGISKIINTMIARDMERFLRFFESAHEKEVCILPNDLYFNEFKKMAGYANGMAAMIYEQKESLHSLNISLEERVIQKTQALQLKNEALEEEREFSQGLLESHKQFIRYAIHETHTPLSVIMANIELFGMNEGRNRYLAKIEAAVKNIFSIYDDLSYLVKKDQVEYPMKAMDLGEYVEQRLEFFDEVAQFSDLSFQCDKTEFPVWLNFNEMKLQRIIDNNLTNAIKYTKKGEVICVGVSSSIDASVFWVESKSQKIQDVEKIFEAYYRERKKTDGFGLGLSLVKSICDEEGVSIRIDSTVERTRFEYRFSKGGVFEDSIA
jgi:signal transduction histidine kinase